MSATHECFCSESIVSRMYSAPFSTWIRAAMLKLPQLQGEGLSTPGPMSRRLCVALPTPMLGIVDMDRLQPEAHAGEEVLWRPWDRRASTINPCPDIPDTIQGKRGGQLAHHRVKGISGLSRCDPIAVTMWRSMLLVPCLLSSWQPYEGCIIIVIV